MIKDNEVKRIQKELDSAVHGLAKRLRLDHISDAFKFNATIGLTLSMVGCMNRNQGSSIYRDLIDNLTFSAQEYVKDMRFKISDISQDEDDLAEFYKRFPPDLRGNSNVTVNGFTAFPIIYNTKQFVVDRVRKHESPSEIVTSVVVLFCVGEQATDESGFNGVMEESMELYKRLIKWKG